MKRLVTCTPIISYCDPNKLLVIECDASSKGLGAALLQDGKPLEYASRSLSASEQRYAQIEKECLAIVFALEKSHQYTLLAKTGARLLLASISMKKVMLGCGLLMKSKRDKASCSEL